MHRLRVDCSGGKRDISVPHLAAAARGGGGQQTPSSAVPAPLTRTTAHRTWSVDSLAESILADKPSSSAKDGQDQAWTAILSILSMGMTCCRRGISNITNAPRALPLATHTHAFCLPTNAHDTRHCCCAVVPGAARLRRRSIERDRRRSRDSL